MMINGVEHDISRDADLWGANLWGADLEDADIRDTCLVGVGRRSDGYRFVGWIREGVLQILAGCRSFSIAEAREHWRATRLGTPLGDETFAILHRIENEARERGLV